MLQGTLRPSCARLDALKGSNLVTKRNQMIGFAYHKGLSEEEVHR